MLYFYGDPHFGDADIMRYENRKFMSVKDMDSQLIRYYNETVTDDDEVIFTGDLGADGYEKDILDILHGKKYLLKGNHDTKENSEYRNFGFIEVYDHPIILEDFWIVSHEPMYVTLSSPYANIFAHVHNNNMYKDFTKNTFCSSVERINYTPISLAEIQKHWISE